jgi:hypothetical protein
VAAELLRPFPDEDLSGRGGLLQTRGHVDCVTGDERVPRARNHLAGVDADAPLQPELLDRRAQLQRRPDGPQSVILVHLGNAEDSHDGVPDELLHRRAVSFEGCAGALEVARLQPAERLGVKPFAPARVAGQVAEEHGDDLAHLSRDRLRDQVGAAGIAEASAFRVLLATTGAGDHGVIGNRARVID